MARLYAILHEGKQIGTVYISEDDDGPLQALHATHELVDVSPPHVRAHGKRAPTADAPGEPPAAASDEGRP